MDSVQGKDLIGPVLEICMGWLKGQPVALVFFLVVIMDIVSGTLVAFYTQKITSEISRKGMIRKAMILLIVSMGFAIEPYAGGILTGRIFCIFFIWNELVSISENAACLGVPLPLDFKNALLKWKESSTSAPIVPVNAVEIKTTVTPAPVSEVSKP